MTKQAPRFLRTIQPNSLKKNRTSVISLFSGCGGMDLEVRQAGWEVRVMVEWDKAACETLRCNWTLDGLRKQHPGYCMQKYRKLLPRWYQKREPVIMQVDITKTSTKEILDAAELQVGQCGMVTGGFPCQGFSLANNKRRVDDSRNVLYKECVRIVREALPKTFLFENVPGLVTMANGRIIDQICKDLASCGYDVSWQKLDAADYGVPQHRVRVLFTGFRRDTLVFPTKGRPRLHIGCAPGRYKHPEFFEKKYKIPSHWPELALAA
jgi:DNA (cytosine-5)-methyltransferase 1